MLKGLPASGKSTHAKELALKPEWKRVNKDDLRAMIDSGKWSRENEKYIITMRDYHIDNALQSGFNIVVDDTNFDPEHETRLKAMADFYGAEFEIKFFDVPVSECVTRDAKRGDKSVGEKVIRGMYNKYLKKNTPYNPSISDAFICDIDGTIAQMNGRGPYDWDKVDTDKRNDNVVTLVTAMAMGSEVIFVSGRDSSCREKTKQWIDDNIPLMKRKGYKLFMRAEGDSRKDNIVKSEIYKNEIKDKYNVLFVLDDRDQVVHMWRELGLTCLQVDYGNF